TLECNNGDGTINAANTSTLHAGAGDVSHTLNVNLTSGADVSFGTLDDSGTVNLNGSGLLVVGSLDVSGTLKFNSTASVDATTANVASSGQLYYNVSSAVAGTGYATLTAGNTL